jgi:signal recognition particle GTPase
MDRQRAQRMGSSSAFFTGRVRILDTLKEHFRARLPGDEKPRRQFLLCGMGGAGKTQIALKFAETTVAETSQTRRYAIIC